MGDLSYNDKESKWQGILQMKKHCPRSQQGLLAFFVIVALSVSLLSIHLATTSLEATSFALVNQDGTSELPTSRNKKTTPITSTSSGMVLMNSSMVSLQLQLSSNRSIISERSRMEKDPDRGVSSYSTEHLIKNTTLPRAGNASRSVEINKNENINHPHAGARDSLGNWGYIADVGMVRRVIVERYHKSQQPSPLSAVYPLEERHQTTLLTDTIENTFSSSGDAQPPLSYLPFRTIREFDAACNVPPREGKERKAGWRLLTQKVRVNGLDPVQLESAITADASHTRSSHIASSNSRTITANSATRVPIPRILCAVYTHEKRHRMLTAVGETWGWRCDGFFAASTKTVPPPSTRNYTNASYDVMNNEDGLDGLGAIDLPHLGEESYDNMWQKTRSIFSYMHDYHADDFDFFFLSGDDTFLIVENLRRILSSMGDEALEYPLYLGHWVPDGRKGHYFCGGGPGYVLNRKTLKILVEEVFPVCHTNMKTSAEDRLLGRCLRKHANILGNHSVDKLNAQRFHGLDPHDTCTIFESTRGSPFFRNLYEFWGKHYGFKAGFNLTSSQSVSFHQLKTSRHLKRIHAILYKSCPRNTTLGGLWYHQDALL